MNRFAIAPELLEILACPVPECRGPLEQTDDGLCCRRCRLVYGMEQGWPNLIPEEARPMREESAGGAKQAKGAVQGPEDEAP